MITNAHARAHIFQPFIQSHNSKLALYLQLLSPPGNSLGKKTSSFSQVPEKDGKGLKIRPSRQTRSAEALDVELKVARSSLSSLDIPFFLRSAQRPTISSRLGSLGSPSYAIYTHYFFLLEREVRNSSFDSGKRALSLSSSLTFFSVKATLSAAAFRLAGTLLP